MGSFRKKVYAVAGYNTVFFGSGRKEFDPTKPMPPMESYLKEVAEGVKAQLPQTVLDEGIIGSFMSGRFLKQANLAGFLPFMLPELVGKPCTAVEGACGTGGRAIAAAVRSVLSDLSDTVFVAGFEMQNGVKAVYGADILAGAAYYSKERPQGHAYFFPSLFSERAGSYYSAYGYEPTRHAMAAWYEQSILNARHNSKAQEFHNTSKDLLTLGLTLPNPERFLPYLNAYDCSKVSDGASAIVIASEDGLRKCGLDKSSAVEIIALGEAEADITLPPKDPLELTTTVWAVQQALQRANLSPSEMGLIEIHDCFSITALLSLEAIGLTPKGEAAGYIAAGKTRRDGGLPVNLSGGLGGFGHPTGASGVRQLVDLSQQLTGAAEGQIALSKPHGMLVSMGGNDKTVTCVIVRGSS